jgi:hypothetical protein
MLFIKITFFSYELKQPTKMCPAFPLIRRVIGEFRVLWWGD